MHVAELDEVTFDLEIDGQLVRRQLHRTVLEKRGWATVVAVYQERDRDGEWKAAKVAFVRLQHVRDGWKKHAAMTLAGDDALALARTLDDWRSALTPETGG